jgi:mono/diheme cytochrome c family protein
MAHGIAAFGAGSLAAALLAAAAIGCGSGNDAPQRPAAPAASAPAEPAPAPPVPEAAGASDAVRKADLIFSTRCATCHGPTGSGDGPGSVALDPKPRDFHDAAWQAQVSDEHLRKIIVEGGGAVGKSPLMLPNPDLVDQPEVVTALVLHVRSLRSH